jgi:hypothetical protein
MQGLQVALAARLPQDYFALFQMQKKEGPAE